MESVIDFFNDLMLSFVSLFVAVDASGVLAIVLGCTEGMSKREQSRMLRYANCSRTRTRFRCSW